MPVGGSLPYLVAEPQGVARRAEDDIADRELFGDPLQIGVVQQHDPAVGRFLDVDFGEVGGNVD